MKKIKELYDKIARKYTERYFEDTIDDEHLLKFLSFLPKRSKILDVGCGPGEITKFFIEKGFHSEGIDISKRMIEIAKKKVPSGKFKVMDMRKIRYPRNSFEGVCAFQSLVHISKKDAKDVIGNFRKIIKPGGFLFLALQEGEGEKETYWPFAKEKTFINYYTIKEIEKELEKNGFNVVYVAKRKPSKEDLPSNKLFIIAKVIK